MSASGDESGGFFRGSRQSPVRYTVACASIVVGIGLLLVGSRVPHPGPLLTWYHWAGMALLLGPMIWLGRQPWSPRRRHRTKLQRLKERRTTALLGVFLFLLYAMAAGFFTAKVYPFSLPIGSATTTQPWWSVLAGAFFHDWILTICAAATFLFVVLAGVSFWIFRKTGAEVRAFQGCCVECGHDLRGLPEPRCPECGTVFDRDKVPIDSA